MRRLFSKQMILCFGLLALAGNGPLFAGYSVLSNLQRQVKMLEEKMAIIEENTALGKQGAQLADGQPVLNNGKGVSLGLDVLYFKTQLGGTAFVYSTNGAGSPYPLLGSTKEIKFNMDFGLRAFLEKRFIEKDWRVGLEYTRFRTTKSNQTQSSILTSQMPLKGILNLGDGVAFAKSNAEVVWNDLSLYLDKSYFVSQTLLVKPMIGLKSSWILLNQWSRYTGGPTLSVNTDHVKDQSKFFGIGPNVGNWIEWFLGKGFSFAGWMDIGLEYGMYHIQYKENQSNLPSSTIKLTQTKHQFSPIFDFGLKVNYGSYFGKNRYYIKAGLGYEVIYFLSQNQALQVFDASAARIQNVSQDLSLNGLNGSISISF